MNIYSETKSSQSKAEMAAVDGRFARGEKTRLNIIEATFSLARQGVLVPTAQQVADESGMGIRTVFRQFSDMEALFIKADEILIKRLFEREKAVPVGDLTQRIGILCEYLNNAYEEYAPYLRMTLVQLWRYKILKKNYKSHTLYLNKQVYQFFPELNDKPKHVQLAVISNCTFEMWDRSRSIGKLKKDELEELMITTLSSLLKN